MSKFYKPVRSVKVAVFTLGGEFRLYRREYIPGCGLRLGVGDGGRFAIVRGFRLAQHPVGRVAGRPERGDDQQRHEEQRQRATGAGVPVALDDCVHFRFAGPRPRPPADRLRGDEAAAGTEPLLDGRLGLLRDVAVVADV